MSKIETRRCAACDLRYDVSAFSPTEVFGLNNQPDDAPICPRCGGDTWTATMSVPNPSETKWDNKKYDVGAGRTFESASDRRKWMAENNVVCVEGAATSMAEQHVREQERNAKRMADIRAGQERAIEQCPETREAMARATAMDVDRFRKQRDIAQQREDRRMEANQRRQRDRGRG